ncbi:MAG: hypothetical protein AAGC53_20285 [Actinomycetota bacterium]
MALTEGTMADSEETADAGPNPHEVRRAKQKLANTTEKLSAFLALDPSDALGQADQLLPTDAQWSRYLDSLSTNDVPSSFRELAEHVRAVCDEVREASIQWVVLDVQTGDEHLREVAYRRLLRARSDARGVFAKTQRELRPYRAGRSSAIAKGAVRHLRDIGSWGVLLGALGVALFGLMRFVDLGVYAHFGVDPDEVGRDSIATIPHAVTMLIALTIFAVLAVSLASLVFGVLAFLWGGVERIRERRSGEAVAATTLSIEEAEVAAADQRAALALGFSLVAFGAVVFMVLQIVSDGRTRIRDCEAHSPLDQAITGFPTAPVVGLEPAPVGLEDRQLAYLGTGPNHVVLYDCNAETVIRLPKNSVAVSTDSASAEDS